jgi:glutathione synthase/RimK-type ligase-like ATP-grasp enzyme
MAKTKRLLVLFTKPRTSGSTSPHDMAEEIAKQASGKYEVDYSFYSHLEFMIDGAKTAVLDGRNQRDLKEYDMVFFRSVRNWREIAGSAATYLHYHKIKFVDEDVGLSPPRSKLNQYMKLWAAHLPVPKTVFANHEKLVEVANQLKFPMVLKDINAARGQRNFLLNNLHELETKLRAYPDNQFVIQRYIPNDGDFRILVYGEEVALILKRQRSQDDSESHLHNTSRGGFAEELTTDDVSGKLLKDAIKAAKYLRRQVAGVDMMVSSKTGKHYVLEVNRGPHLTRGAFVAKKMEKLNAYFANKFDLPHSVLDNKIVIGAREYISIPELGLKDVRARVDSGALVGSLHCRDIKLSQDGKELSFTVYKNKQSSKSDPKMTTEKFRQIILRSAFGKAHKRYVVPFMVEVAGQRVMTQLSLVDRSEMTYPVLLGRRFLRQGNFVVDVEHSSVLPRLEAK